MEVKSLLNAYSFIINPVLIDTVLLVTLGLIFNNLIPNRYYPYREELSKDSSKSVINEVSTSVSQSDITEALEKMGIYQCFRRA